MVKARLLPSYTTSISIICVRCSLTDGGRGTQTWTSCYPNP